MMMMMVMMMMMMMMMMTMMMMMMMMIMIMIMMIMMMMMVLTLRDREPGEEDFQVGSTFREGVRVLKRPHKSGEESHFQKDLAVAFWTQ